MIKTLLSLNPTEEEGSPWPRPGHSLSVFCGSVAAPEVINTQGGCLRGQDKQDHCKNVRTRAKEHRPHGRRDQTARILADERPLPLPRSLQVVT